MQTPMDILLLVKIGLAIPLAVLGVYILGRVFGLGALRSLIQYKNSPQYKAKTPASIEKD